MAYDNKNFGDNNNNNRNESIFSKRIRAGKRRTYFFDVRATRGNDYFITITESKKRFDDNGYERHKMFLYKEDFNKFIAALIETVDYVKTDLMPDFDFDAFNHDNDSDDNNGQSNHTPASSNGQAHNNNTSNRPLENEETETKVEETPAHEEKQEPIVAETSSISSANDNDSVDEWKI